VRIKDKRESPMKGIMKTQITWEKQRREELGKSPGNLVQETA
jgi:hypothetical protein